MRTFQERAPQARCLSLLLASSGCSQTAETLKPSGASASCLRGTPRRSLSGSWQKPENWWAPPGCHHGSACHTSSTLNLPQTHSQLTIPMASHLGPNSFISHQKDPSRT